VANGLFFNQPLDTHHEPLHQAFQTTHPGLANDRVRSHSLSTLVMGRFAPFARRATPGDGFIFMKNRALASVNIARAAILFIAFLEHSL